MKLYHLAKIETTLITNGLLLNKDRCISLRNSGLKGIQISLHSGNEDEHDEITGTKGSYIKTISNIINAIDIFGSDFINVNMVATKKTCLKIYNTAKKLKGIGVTNFSTSSFSYSGLGKTVKNSAPHKKDFNTLFNQILKAKKELGISALISGAFPLCVLEIDPNKEVLELLGNICDAGITQLVIGPNGEIRPCVSYNFKLGNILQDDVSFIWNNNIFLNDLRLLKHIPKECNGCEHLIYCFGGCRASAFENTNTLSGIHPLLEN